MGYFRRYSKARAASVVASGSVIADARRLDWSSIAGVEGGIPTGRTQSGSTISAYSGTAGTINTAIAGAASGTYVLLGAGTFTLTTTINLTKSNVTLRGTVNGDGTLATTIVFDNTGGSGFFFGGENICVYVAGSFDSSGYSGGVGTPQQGGVPPGNRISWTGCNGSSGSYPRGATVFDVASNPSGLSVGDMLFTWQDDESAASLPKDGFWVSPKRDTSGSPSETGVNWQGGNSDGSCMQQRHRVVSKTSTQITVWPGIIHPSGAWKTANSPKVGWQGGDLKYSGLESLIIDGNTSGPLDQWSCVQFWQASNCWMRNCIVVPKTGARLSGNTTQMAVQMFESRNLTIENNWIHRCVGGGQGSTTSYGISPVDAFHCLVQNNIVYQIEGCMLQHAGSCGNVYFGNYEIFDQEEGGIQLHETGLCMNLYEHNHTKKIFADIFHGAGMINTFYRNYLFGADCGFDFQAYHRYNNCIGNVIAATGSYASDTGDGDLTFPYANPDSNLRARDVGVAFRTGMPGESDTNDAWWNGAPNIGVKHDLQVKLTLFRWGNYTSVDSTTRFSAGEVPTSEPFFPNALPPSNAFRASEFYTSGRPPWWSYNGTQVQWPAIGSDVTGGADVGGRVHKLPARLAYEAAGVGNYSGFKPSLYGV